MFLDFVYEYVEIIPRSSHISSENYLIICSEIKKNYQVNRQLTTILILVQNRNL